MNRINLQLVSCVTVLASLAFWPETTAVNLSPRMSTVPPKTTLNPTGTPCDFKTCPSGRRCALDENGQALCVCYGDCYEHSSAVCGSDNRTYTNRCELTREACRTNTNIAFTYYGRCKNEDSICIGVTCPSNRECAVADHRPTCVCIQDCPTYNNAVCGSNNQTYLNDCNLKRQSCVTRENITVAYRGQCKQETVCDGVRCPNGGRCAVDERHQPVCVCIDKCPFRTDIVCGSDNRTYGNECELQKEACYTNTGIRVVNKGFCLQGSVCYGHQCPSDKQCTVDQNNRPVCVCNASCSYDYNPVCGSNGDTYRNLCWLKVQACTTGNNLTVARTGPCIYDEYCNGVVCPSPRFCVVDAENQTSCVCSRNCGDIYYPVCGSNNKTYDNYCEMYAALCQANTNITTFYMGVCSEGSNCEGIFCGDGKHCDSENQSEPKCVCDTVCPKTYNPVCGSNNVTYNNSCELQREACLTNTSIKVQFYGGCKKEIDCSRAYCPYGRTCVEDVRKRPMCVCSQECLAESNEVCGTDNKTYSSECFLTAAACLTNKNITVLRDERCKEDSPCSGFVCSSERYCDLGPNGRPICVCNEKCSSYDSGVCGSDNRTYVNYCELRKQSCLSSQSIQGLYYGRCVEASVCDGVSCSPDKRCAIDEQNQPTCVCIDECQYGQYAVCGSDGRTYYNECELQKEACTTNRNVTLVYRGICQKGLTCADIDCPSGLVCALNEKIQPVCVCSKVNCSSYSYSPVCGTDGKTYDNSCYPERRACMTDSNIKKNYDGPCRNEANPLTSTTKQCIGSRCARRSTPASTTPTSRRLY